MALLLLLMLLLALRDLPLSLASQEGNFTGHLLSAASAQQQVLLPPLLPLLASPCQKDKRGYSVLS